jgi:peroxiredoxin
MKRMLLSCILLCTGITLLSAQGLEIGQQVPLGELAMKDISGKEISVKQAGARNGVLVMFSCNTCPYVIKNQQRTLALAAFAKANNIGVILLNSNEGSRNDADSYDAMQKYAKAQGYQFYYAVDKDSKLANAYGATRTPEVYLFDANGVLQYKGAIDDNPADASNVKRIHAREAIQELVAGKTVSVKSSRSVGCAIKRSE